MERIKTRTPSQRVGLWLRAAGTGGVLSIGLLAWTLVARGASPKFYPDDPIASDAELQDASGVKPVKIADPYDFAENSFFGAGDHSAPRAMNINTLDEVPNSSWFTNRIGTKPMSIDEIVKGPDKGTGPADGPWTIVAGKTEGITPGMTIRDSAGDIYFIKFDPPTNPQMATGAEVISTKFFYALGFEVPENYIAIMRREQLSIADTAMATRVGGERVKMEDKDLDVLLKKAARDEDGSYRVIASKGLSGKPMGPFRYYGTRPDDPNDIFPHEHHRELRGMRIFSAWLNHDDSRAINSLDMLVARDGRSILQHHLIDFGSTLGSGSVTAQKPRAGNEYLWEGRPTFLTMLTLGFYVRPWIKVKYPDIPAVGNVESDFFEPENWKPEYPNPAFLNTRPDDTFWAARRVAAISEDAIKAVVHAARYSDPAAETYLDDVISGRRAKVIAYWLTDVNPLVDFTMDATGAVTFGNAAVDASVSTPASEYKATWFAFDNATGSATPLGGAVTAAQPKLQAPTEATQGDYVLLEVGAVHKDYAVWSKPVKVYFRKTASGWQTVGLERWPDMAEPSSEKSKS